MPEIKFINEKSDLLINSFNQFLMHKTSYDVLTDLVWDILHGWQSLDVTEDTVSGPKEQVFWHMVFELQYWDKASLSNDNYLRKKLYSCVLYLQQQKDFPDGCIGLRPNKLLSQASSPSLEQEAVA